MTKKDTGIYIELRNLGNFAGNTASILKPRGSVSGYRLAAKCRKVLTELRETADKVTKAGETGAAAQWFSDNWYIAEREGKDAEANLKHAGRFPAIYGGQSIVSEAAASLVRSGRGEVTAERIRVFLDEYQNVSELSQKELSVFTSVTKIELTAFLRDVVTENGGFADNDGELAFLLKNIFTSLRFLSGTDLTDTLEAVNRMEETLRRDPAGVYHLMDDDTRYNYRRELSHLASKEKISEHEAARAVLRLSEEGENKHVGHYIFTSPMGREKKVPSGGLYIGTIVLISLFLTVLSGVLLSSYFAAALLIIPISEIVKNLVDYVALKTVHPTRLPRLEFPAGIPKGGRTMCVISALLSSEADGPRYARLLEEYRLLNRDAGENLLFGILADLKEAGTQRVKSDAVILETTKRAVDALNRKYGGGFFLFTRERFYSEADGIYVGRERKRGAISELVMLLSGEQCALDVTVGENRALIDVNFILTLDSDTRLTAESAREMIGAAMHPLNTPVVDEKTGRVIKGYGIFQPRVSTDLEAAGKSDFAKIFAGQGGIDPYNSAVSEVYQDMFCEGTFMGKGLINIRVYKMLLQNTFPENAILSHDILEGAYLRCAFLSDTELTDGFPYKVTSYFSRQERWTRGDWQNFRWMLPRVKNRTGALIKNPLSDINRWKIFDNIRRSMVPVFILASLIAGMLISETAFAVSAAIAVFSLMSGLLLSSAEAIIRHDGSTRARYQSAIISGLGGAIMQTAIRLMLLPAEAWNQFRAAVTAVYRMAVTKRKLLTWVTSSDAERKYGNTIRLNYFKLAACPSAGLAVMLFSPYAAAAAVGLVWLFAPAYAWALGRESKKERSISHIDRAFLLTCAGDIWKFFDENLSDVDNFLPPDNVQIEPDVGVAHRTSPTNIGLAILSAFSAAKLGIISDTKACEIAEKIITSIEKLDKWNGHLYNWYDTRTLRPLEPKYVSSVDSGNLAGCLITAKQMLEAMGERELSKRCERLFENMDFRPLYDRKRKLFYIGWDMGKDSPTEGWYDLLSSEARETSYIAIATGQVPRKHWRRLGRALVSQDNYSGMVSWTGTMFEYLMPNLILPLYENSLLYESSRFCIYAQKRAVKGIPWGISESAFYSFDPGLSYKYKAHGAQRLALKRKMALDTVISPYSTFLALPLDPKGAVKNLRRLAAMGMGGKYGFYEAADFTPSRVSNGKFETVRTFMAHHLGMSIVAIANTLCQNVFPKYFMSDARMSAYREILQERVPTNGIVLRQPPRDIPEKPGRRENMEFSERITEIHAFSPKCLPLSNGTYSVLMTESGKTRSEWEGYELTRFDPDVLGGAGMEFYLKTPEGIFSLLPVPNYEKNVSYASEFSENTGKVFSKCGQYSTAVSVFVPPTGAGEVRTVDVAVTNRTPRECSLICAFEPVLERRADFTAHPAFLKLSLEAEASENKITLRRRARGKRPERFMTVAVSSPANITTERERGDPVNVGEFKKTSPEMRVAISVPLAFSAGRATVSFALAPGYSREESEREAERILQKPVNPAISRVGAAALMLGLKTAHVRRAMGHITGLLFNTKRTPYQEELMCRGGYRREDLWKFSVSGDLPILCAKIENSEQIDNAEKLVKEHAFLSENGIKSDLVLLITDGGDYLSTQRRALQDLLRRLGREGTLGAAGGVFLADAADPEADALIALSNLFIDFTDEVTVPSRAGRMPVRQPEYERGAEPLSFDIGKDGEFVMTSSDTLPKVAWSQVLANSEFGYLATEAGTGYMWYKNAREMKINRWLNDPLTVSGTERLELIRADKRVSLFAGGDGYKSTVRYGFGYAVWEKEIDGVKSKVTAFVPQNTALRVMIIELEGDVRERKLSYFTELSMGGDNLIRPRVKVTKEEKTFKAELMSGEYAGTAFSVACSEEAADFTSDRLSFLEGDMDERLGVPASPAIAMSFGAVQKMVIVAGCEEIYKEREFCDLDKALSALRDTKEYWRKLVLPVEISTASEDIDKFTNGWALYQTIACRIFARTALYQNGGAVGFRDQLQDVCAVTTFAPEMTARQIKLSAEHQYLEGDVQHWWHPGPGGDKGVRTRCSDDLMWLPYALCDYVEKTGDHGLCRTLAHFINSKPLEKGEEDRYETPSVFPDKNTILNHAIRAAEMFISRGTGEHGLALMLSGDWNDGMDEVGKEGRGESVWLTWFGAMTLKKLSALCKKEGESKKSEYFADHAERLINAAEKTFTGEWFLRGYYDDGHPLGAPDNIECRIDSIAQSFSVFADADKNMSQKAVSSAYANLYDMENRVVKLFTPSFGDGPEKPGYIKGYAVGYRENGGQYTHGAIWLAIALMRLGERERGAELLAALAPGGRNMEKYKAEPYVLAADVYSALGHEGRGGWTWYTGSAGWYYRAVTEELMGLRVRDGILYVEPSIPESWGKCRIKYDTGLQILDISCDPRNGMEVLVNGEPYKKEGYPLKIHNKFISSAGKM